MKKIRRQYITNKIKFFIPVLFLSLILFLVCCGTCAASNGTSNETWSTPEKAIDNRHFDSDFCVDDNGTVHYAYSTINNNGIQHIYYKNSKNTTPKLIYSMITIPTTNPEDYSGLYNTRINHVNGTLYLTFYKINLEESYLGSLMCVKKTTNSSIWSNPSKIATLESIFGYKESFDSNGNLHLSYGDDVDGDDSAPDNKGNLNSVYIKGNSIYYKKTSSTPPQLVTTFQNELKGIKILQDIKGNLHILYKTGNEYENFIRRSWYTSLNIPLKADFEYSAHSTGLLVSQIVDFDASKSTGNIETYLWEFGDGLSPLGSNKNTMNHVYSGEKSIYKVTLTVFDYQGNFDSITKEIQLDTDFDTKDFDINSKNPIPALEPVLSSSGMAYLLKETYENIKYTTEKLHQEVIVPAGVGSAVVNDALNSILKPLLSLSTSLQVINFMISALLLTAIVVIGSLISTTIPLFAFAAMLLLLIRNSGMI